MMIMMIMMIHFPATEASVNPVTEARCRPPKNIEGDSHWLAVANINLCILCVACILISFNIYLSIYLSIYPSIHPSIHPFIHPCACANRECISISSSYASIILCIVYASLSLSHRHRHLVVIYPTPSQSLALSTSSGISGRSGFDKQFPHLGTSMGPFPIEAPPLQETWYSGNIINIDFKFK